MKGKDLLNAFGRVDDELISEAEEKKPKKLIVKFALPAAACFAVVLTAVLLALNTFSAEVGTAYEGKYTLDFNKTDSMIARDLYIKGHFWKELTQEQKVKLLPIIAEKYPLDGTVNYSRVNGVTSVFNINTAFQTDGREVKITMAQGKIAKCCVVSGEPMISEIEGVKIEAGIFVTDKNSKGERKCIYYADFLIDDIAYYAEYTGGKNENDFFTSVIADIILGGKADFTVLDDPSVPELRDEDLTEKEAYNESDFGAYLPKVPNDYQFNSAKRFINQVDNSLSASWSKGYNDVRFRVSKLTEQDRTRIVSPSDKELYDMSLYPVPWADSMPEDTREIIENPIFKIEDLTVEIVKMREYLNDESVNMRFSVLYGDILAEVSAEGLSAEYLFNELSALPKS